jgi:phage-related baseplate assembly protein
VAAVQAYLDGKKPVTDTPTVVAATAVPVTVTGTVKVRSASYNTETNRNKARDAVAAYFAGLGIGDDVDLGAIYAAIRSADGILDVDITDPSGDTAVSTSQIATYTYSIGPGDWST